MSKYKMGEKVELISGGPQMTITGSGNRVSSCIWFEGSKVHTEIFQNEWLKLSAAGAGILAGKKVASYTD